MNELVKALTDMDAAGAASFALEEPSRLLQLEVGWGEAVEVFRRVSAGEIKAGGFLTSFGEAVAAADLPNQALLLPAIYKLLAKYPALLEQHRAKPAITTFPPSE